MRYFVVFFAGLLFGAGLLLSGMVNPAKVLNFLDVFGTWDPSLAFVMLGAISVTAGGYFVLKREMKEPLFAACFRIPTRSEIDVQLLGGAALFGIGWGLGGLCPGPALASLMIMKQGTLVFVPMMLLGIYLGQRIGRPGA